MDSILDWVPKMIERTPGVLVAVLGVYQILLMNDKLGMTKEFNPRFPNINWETYCNNKPFENSAFALYKWAPIADELKKFDKQIVLNSVFLKWNNVQKDFKKLVNNFTGN